jgi:CubicO group peptidase (beta-lactamase class C family)
MIFPKEEWQASTPEKQGINSKKMKVALDYLESNSGHNGNKELAIICNGYMIYEGENVDSTHNIWSCSKTFTSTVLGLLVDDKVISLDSKAADFEPLLKTFYSEVSFGNFVTLTSGYSAEGSSRLVGDKSSDWSITAYKPENPMFAPGTQFAYWDEAQMMFGRILTQVLNQSMESFLKKRITNKIGMGDWNWEIEKELNGIPINNGGTGVFVNAKQLARWGLLFLNNGNWDGTQLISKEWINMSTSVQVPVSIPVADTDRRYLVGSGCYGLNWWVNGRKANGEMKFPGAPEGCYFASGNNNNKCIVIPQWNMVVARMGEDGYPKDSYIIYGTFLRLLGESFENK